MITNGFISLHRSLLKWEWYDDINTTRLFIHLLLTVNYYDETWHGIEIKRGQRVISLPKLANEIQLTIQQTRTALKHLQSTNEITCSTSPQNTIVTILQYDKYQTSTNKSTDNQQTTILKSTDKSTDNQQLSNNTNKSNKEITYTADFEEFYSLYPNPFNKPQTYRNFINTLKEDTFGNIMIATRKYIEVLKGKPDGKNKQFIKRSTNFVGQQKEYKGYLEMTQQTTIEQLTPIVPLRKVMRTLSREDYVDGRYVGDVQES